MKLKLLSLYMKLFVLSVNADDENVKIFSKKNIAYFKKSISNYSVFLLGSNLSLILNVLTNFKRTALHSNQCAFGIVGSRSVP